MRDSNFKLDFTKVFNQDSISVMLKEEICSTTVKQLVKKWLYISLKNYVKTFQSTPSSLTCSEDILHLITDDYSTVRTRIHTFWNGYKVNLTEKNVILWGYDSSSDNLLDSLDTDLIEEAKSQVIEDVFG